MTTNKQDEPQPADNDPDGTILNANRIMSWWNDAEKTTSAGQKLDLEVIGKGDELTFRPKNHESGRQNDYVGKIGQNTVMVTSNPEYLPSFVAVAAYHMRDGQVAMMKAGPTGPPQKRGGKRVFKLGYKIPTTESAPGGSSTPTTESAPGGSSAPSAPSAPSAGGGQAQQQAQGKDKARTFSERVEDDDEVIEIHRSDFPPNQGAKQPSKKAKGNNGQQAPQDDDIVGRVKKLEAMLANQNAKEKGEVLYNKDGTAVGKWDSESNEFNNFNPTWARGGRGGRGGWGGRGRGRGRGGRGGGNWQQHFGSQNQQYTSYEAQPQQQPPKWKAPREPGDNRPRIEDSIHADHEPMDTDAAPSAAPAPAPSVLASKETTLSFFWEYAGACQVPQNPAAELRRTL